MCKENPIWAALAVYDPASGLITLEALDTDDEKIKLGTENIGNAVSVPQNMVNEFIEAQVQDCVEHKRCLLELFPDSILNTRPTSEAKCYRLSCMRNGELIAIGGIQLRSARQLRMKDLVDTYLSMTGMILQRVNAVETLRVSEENLEELVKQRTADLMTANEQLKQEILERQQVEEALRESEEKYKTLTDNINIGVYRNTPGVDGKFIEMNPAHIEMFGYDSKEQFLKVKVADLYQNPEDRRKFSEKLSGSGIVRYEEVHLKKKDGTPFIAAVSAVAVKDQDGKLMYFDGIIEDITERKEAREALQKARDELEMRVRERTIELTKANEELRTEIVQRGQAEKALAESNAELQNFAYVASHDLQEPLRMVAIYLQLLERRYKGELDDNADDFINFAVDGAIRMQKLINGLLTYSRVSTRGKKFEPTDCRAILEDTLLNLQIAIEESEAVVTHDPLPTVMADDTQLVQLFQNLIGNAIKFRNQKPPRVHVSAERNGAEWLFSVQDNGIGIEPEHKERIFAIFQRLHGLKDYPGTGIGLAICKRIVLRHGGRIWLESQPGSGSTFYFTIPATGGSNGY